jgi:hypothetical protein
MVLRGKDVGLGCEVWWDIVLFLELERVLDRRTSTLVTVLFEVLNLQIYFFLLI